MYVSLTLHNLNYQPELLHCHSSGQAHANNPTTMKVATCTIKFLVVEYFLDVSFAFGVVPNADFLRSLFTYAIAIRFYDRSI
jgi:hypothetical protein